MASELGTTANANEGASTATSIRTGDDGNGNGNENEHRSVCSLCEEPWCDGKWHSAQRDVMDDIVKNFYHPGLSWSAYMARCNFEVVDRERRKIVFLSEQSNIQKRIEEEDRNGDTEFEDEEHFVVADGNAKELDVVVVLPSSNRSKKYKGYFIGSSDLDDNDQNWRCLIALVEVADTSFQTFHLILCTNENLPEEVISWSKRFRMCYQHHNKYDTDPECFNNVSILKKMDGSNVFYLPFFGEIIDRDFHLSLKNGLLMVNKKKNNKWSFRLALRDGLWYGNGNDIALLKIFEPSVKSFTENKGLHLREVRGMRDVMSNVTTERILSIALAAKYEIGKTYSSKGAVLKALQTKYNAPTTREKCIANILDKSNVKIGSIIPCHHQRNNDIDISQIADRELKRKLKNAKKTHTNNA